MFQSTLVKLMKSMYHFVVVLTILFSLYNGPTLFLASPDHNHLQLHNAHVLTFTISHWV